MTEINKALHRRTRASFNVLHHRKARKIIVSICPGDYLEFRESNRRGRWQLPIDAAFRISIRIKADADRRAKKERK